jgi:hypothetical protein
VSVPATPEAQDAMLDQQVPQTAAVKRSDAKLGVKYDGQPQFKQVPNTKVEYAVNTSSQVLRIANKYYACDQGIWFASDKATGPWVVADSIPTDEIAKIPPSEPVHNVTYVHVYDATPSVVYVGYTPGYVYCYPWYGVPVYGTGWYYPPYWGAVYYPRPVTYGVHVSYNPWYGWGMGYTWSNGFLTVGVHFGGGYGGYYRPGYPPYYRPPGYWPPYGYRPPYYGGYPGWGRPGYPGGGYPGHRPSQPGWGAAGSRPTQLPANNIYNNAANRGRVAASDRTLGSNPNVANRVGQGPNNVYGDRNGNVHRQQGNQWQTRENGQWKSSGGASPSTGGRPAQTPSSGPSSGNLNRDAQARKSGASREASSPSRGSSTPARTSAPRTSGGRR